MSLLKVSIENNKSNGNHIPNGQQINEIFWLIFGVYTLRMQQQQQKNG